MAISNIMPTFAPAIRNGALDEWLSLRSAKPSTAVRIRQAPPEESKRLMEISTSLFSYPLHVVVLEDIRDFTDLLFIKPLGEFLLGLFDDGRINI